MGRTCARQEHPFRHLTAITGGPAGTTFPCILSRMTTAVTSLALAAFVFAGAMLAIDVPAHADSDGDVRLRDGPTASHGRLEVFHDGQWGGVCDDFFGKTNATVACRQLGYTDGEARRSERRPLPEGMSFWLDNLNCSGTESQLGLCPHNGWGIHNCGAREAASVFCTGTKQTSTPLPDAKPATGVSVSGATTTTVGLSWTLPAQGSGVTVTSVEVQQQSGTTWSAVATLAADATSHTVTGLTAGTTYSFRVRLVTSNGNADSDAVSVDTLAAPKPATGLAALSPTLTTVDLAWTLPAQPSGVSITGVEVLQQGADESWSTIVTLAADATSHTVTGLTADATYSFRIRLVTSNGNADSSTVSADTLAAPKPATGLAASNPTLTTVDLAWTLPEQAAGVTVTGVEVQQQGADESWSTIATLAANATSHTVTGLTAGTTYNLRVRLVTSSGNADSDAVSADTLAPPPAPQNVATQSVEDYGHVTLTWTAPEYDGVITQYQVRYGALTVHGNHDWKEWVSISNGNAALSHTVTGLTSFKVYGFQVRAMAGTLPGAESELVHATTGGPQVSLIVPDDSRYDVLNFFVKEGESFSGEAVLTSRPPESVSVSVTSGEPAAVAVSPASLTFTTSNWNVAQTVTVTGVQDSDADNERYILLSFTVEPETNQHLLAAGANFSVSVYDDDPAAPIHVKARSGDGHVTLSWTAPSSPYGRNEITGYEYRQCRGSATDCSDDDQFGQWLSAGSSNSHKVTPLNREQSYTFQVRAVAGTYKGLASSKVTAAPRFDATVALTVGWVHPMLIDQSPTIQERFWTHYRIEGRNLGPLNGITAGRKLNFAADTYWNSGVRSVHLELTGPKTATRTDSSEPFTLFEDYVGETMPAGDYTLSATAYSEADKGGAAGTKQSVEFTLAADNDAPTVRVLCSEPKSTGWVQLANGSPAPSSGIRVGVKVLFSELVTGFDPSDVEVSNVAESKGGMAYSLRKGPTPFPVDFTIPQDASGEIQVTVPAGAAEDLAGNRNTASEPLNLAQNRTVSVSDARGSEGSAIEFEVTLNAANDCETVTVDYATADGTAMAGTDYTATSGTLTFGPGETTKTINVAVTDDETSESSEAFTLNLSNVEGATLADAQATGTITETSQQQVLAVPVAATGLESPSQTQTTADLGWTVPGQPHGVTVTGVEVKQQSGAAWTTIATLTADATSHKVTGLSAGTTYIFRIRLVTSNGNADSDSVSVETLAAPNPATGLTASNPTQTTVDLAWTLPAQAAGVTVTGVEVQQQGAADESWSTIATLAANVTSHTMTGLTAGTTYNLRIRLVTSSGNADSDTLAVDTLAAPKPATGLTASNPTQTTVDLAWTLPTQASGVSMTGVEVQQQGSDNAWTTVATLAADATSHSLTGLTAGTTYNLRIRLVTSSGNADSDVVSADTLAAPNPATGLTASNPTQTTVDLAWTLPTQASGVSMTGVEVQQQGSDNAWTTVATLAADATSHSLTGLTAGTTYNLRVRLVTSSGNADSDVVSADTLAAPNPATGLTASNPTQTTVDLAWTLPTQASGVSMTGVEVQQQGSDNAWTTVATLAADAISHTVTGLTAGTTHSFRVRLVTSSGNADSDAVSASTMKEPALQVSVDPLPATALAASNPKANAVDLAWTLPTQSSGVTVTGVEVQRQSGGSWSTIAALAAVAESFTVTGLDAGTDYSFRIRLATSVSSGVQN